VSRQAYARLLGDHLACWIPPFADRVREAALEPYHVAAADALEALVRGEAEAQRVEAG
jgi:TorA maturation chaperone TorD